MRCPKFRHQHLFVRTGVIGSKRNTVIGFLQATGDGEPCAAAIQRPFSTAKSPATASAFDRELTGARIKMFPVGNSAGRVRPAKVDVAGSNRSPAPFPHQRLKPPGERLRLPSARGRHHQHRCQRAVRPRHRVGAQAVRTAIMAMNGPTSAQNENDGPPTSRSFPERRDFAGHGVVPPLPRWM